MAGFEFRLLGAQHFTDLDLFNLDSFSLVRSRWEYGGGGDDWQLFVHHVIDFGSQVLLFLFILEAQIFIFSDGTGIDDLYLVLQNPKALINLLVLFAEL